MNTSFIIGNLKYFIAYLKLFLNSPNIKLRKAGYTCLIRMDIFSTKKLRVISGHIRHT